MHLPVLAVVVCVFLSASSGDEVRFDAFTTSAPTSVSHEANQTGFASEVSVKRADGLETAPRLALDEVKSTSESPSVLSSSTAVDYGTLSTVEGTTEAVSPLERTDTIEFRVLVGLSCKWVNGDGVERRSRVCPLQSTCNLGPITIVKKSGLDQRLYFCSGTEQSLVSIACTLEDSERVVVLPRCMTGTRCSVGPLALNYRGRQVRGYFCDAQMLASSSRTWSDRQAAGGSGPGDTWTVSGSSQLNRNREEEPRRGSNLSAFNGGDSGGDNGTVKNWMQEGKDKGKYGNDNDDEHVRYEPKDREDERYTTVEALNETMTTSETTKAETVNVKRRPGTTA